MHAAIIAFGMQLMYAWTQYNLLKKSYLFKLCLNSFHVQWIKKVHTSLLKWQVLCDMKKIQTMINIVRTFSTYIVTLQPINQGVKR